MGTGYTDTFGGSPVQPSNVAYAAVALSASINAYWPAFVTGSQQVLARIMDVTPSAGSLTITMPDARQAAAGQDVTFTNLGAYTYTVLDNSGATIASVAPGQQKYLYLTSNSTAAGTWRTVLFGVGASSPDASSLAGYGVKAIGATLNQSMPVVSIAANQSVDATFRAKQYVNTGGAVNFTLTLATTVGNDFFFAVRNQGSGVVTISPTGGDTIDGVSSIQLQLNESCIILAGTGTWYTLGRGRNTQFNFTQLVKSITGGTVTLTLAEASNIVQNYTGTLTSNATVVLPAVVQVYYISNTTSGAYTVTFQSPTPGSTFVLPQNQAAVVFCDGTNVTNTTTTISGATSLLLNGGSAGSPPLAFISANNGLFAPSSAAVAVSAAGVEQIRWSGNQSLSVDGTAALPAYSFQAEAGTGVYRSTTNTLGFATGAAARMTLDGSGNLVPANNGTQNFGSASFTWGNVYAATFNGAGTGLTGTASGLTVGTAATAANASQLLGATWASPGTIGSTTPNSGAFTTLTSTDAISSSGFYKQSADYAEVRMRAASGANLNAWRLTSGINGASDGALTVQHSTDNFAANFTNALVADSSGNVGIGAAPTYDLDISKTKTGTALVSRVYNAGTGAGSEASLRVVQGTVYGTISAQGDSVLYIGASSNHTVVLLQNSVEVIRINTAKEVLVTNPAGLGYGTGAGGTVTQATSKSTGVTLNKPTGQITMNNAALAAGAFVTFQLTNSVIASTDGVFVYIKNPVSGLANYRVQAGDVGAGYCWISLQNVSAGSLSDAAVIGFSVIKGSNA